MRHINVKEQKSTLRAHYLALRATLSPARKAEADSAITAALIAHPLFAEAKVILLYAPRPDEIDTYPLLAAALAAGKRAAYPRCFSEHEMEFRFVRSRDDLHPDAFGIPAPGLDCPLYDPQTDRRSVLVITPGLSFDRQGYRLGYGKGYYDRYFEHLHLPTVGLIYEEFIHANLPRGYFDRPVDCLVTERGVFVRA